MEKVHYFEKNSDYFTLLPQSFYQNIINFSIFIFSCRKTPENKNMDYCQYFTFKSVIN